MNGGYYPRRRGILEHLDMGRIELIDLAIHDMLCQLAQVFVGGDSCVPPGVVITSAPAIASRGRCHAKVAQRSLERLEAVGFIKRWMVKGKHGSYPILINKFEVRDASMNKYRINCESTTSWEHPIAELVHDDEVVTLLDVSAEVSADMSAEVSAEVSITKGKRTKNREQREVEGNSPQKTIIPGEIKTTPPFAPGSARSVGGIQTHAGDEIVAPRADSAQKAATLSGVPLDQSAENFVDYAKESFFGIFGQWPDINGRAWGNLAAVALLEKLAAYSIEELKTRWDRSLATRDKFKVKMRGNLLWFLEHFDDYITAEGEDESYAAIDRLFTRITDANRH